MPININYQPAAGLLAGSALIAGQGQYAQNVNQLLTQQWQTAAQIQNARLMALQQAAMENQRQQSQQAFQMQMMPMQAGIEAQQQAFQTNLGMQSDAAKQAMQAYYGQQQSQQDFSEQQALQAQRSQQEAQNHAAQLMQQQQGQVQNQQQMAQFNNDQSYLHQFQQDPLVTMRQNRQQAQQSGYSYSPEQEQQMQEAQKNLTAMQDAVSNKRNTLPTFLDEIKNNMGTLNRVSANPSVPPPQKPSEQFSQNTAWFQPNATDGSQAITDQYSQGAIPVQMDKKSGLWKPVVKPSDIGSSEVGEDGQIINEKTRGLKLSNQIKERKVNLDREEWVDKKIKSFMASAGPMAGVLPDGQPDPMWQQVLEGERQKAYATYDQAAHMTPSGVAPVGPQQQAPPPAGIPGPQVTGQNPQGQPNQNVNGQQPQMLPPQDIEPLRRRLSSIPRNQWTLEDAKLWEAALLTKKQMGM